MLLLLRLTLVPCLIALVTLATRRWGPRVGGLLMAMPVVAGPTLVFYAIEQGSVFAADAAASTLVGLVAVAAFCVVYAACSTRWGWPRSVVCGWLAFGVVTSGLYRMTLGPVPALVLALVALLAARGLIDTTGVVPDGVSVPPWDLPLRMAAAATLVFVLTSLAERLGPELSGALVPFPVATAIIAGFTHAQAGPVAARRFLHVFIPGLCTFAVFCFVLAFALRAVGLAAAFAAAFLVQLTLQAIILSRRPTASAAVAVAAPRARMRD